MFELDWLEVFVRYVLIESGFGSGIRMKKLMIDYTSQRGDFCRIMIQSRQKGIDLDEGRKSRELC